MRSPTLFSSPESRTRAARQRRRAILRLETCETRIVPALSTGVWSQATAAPTSLGTMMLLSDGRVIAQGGGVSKSWFALTPDVNGSYQAGTWSTLASMSLERLYFGSNILPSGKLFLVGGEYTGPTGASTFTNTGEVYDPVSNTWSSIANFPQGSFGDDPTELLPNGKILAGYISGPQTYIYDPATNSWSQTGTKLRSDQSDEETWVILPDSSILSYDIFSSPSSGAGHAQRYVPATGLWVDAGSVPVPLSGSALGSELGPATLLPDGRVFQTGASVNTALYNPSTNTWTAGPLTPNGDSADDSPGAMLPDGNFIYAADTALFTAPTRLYDFDPVTNVISQMTVPSQLTTDLNGPAYTKRMLVLPTGQVLLASGAASRMWLYTPTGTPDAAWRPTISAVDANMDGSYTLTGTQLNGISEGASYGDDAEMSSNYPIVRLTDGANHVYYARTFNWSSTGVATGSTPVTTQFTLPAGLAAGHYALSVVANGIASAPRAFSTGFSVASSIPSVGGTVGAAPTSYVVTFAAAVDASSLQASDLTVNGLTASSVTLDGGLTSATFTFNTSPVVAQGAQTIAIAAGSISKDGDPSIVITAFSGSFRYDTLPLQIVSTTPAANATSPPPLTTLDVNLNEPVANASVGTSDLALTQGSVTGFSLQNGGQTVRFTVSGLSGEGSFTAGIAAGAFTDAAGNPLAASFSGTYVLDYSTRSFTAPAAVAPLGSQVYQGSMTGLVNPLPSGTDADDFTLTLNPGETLSLLLTPATGLRPRITLLSPSLAVLADVSASAAGQAVTVAPMVITTAGVYTFRVQGVSGSTGTFTLQTTLNAAIEAESVAGGAANNGFATAQSLVTTTTTTPQGSAGRASVAGVTDVAAGYAASTVTYNFEDITATGATVLTSLDDDFASITIPFGFSFYGTSYTTVFPSTNGLLTFTSGSTEYSNTDLTSVPATAGIAVFWDDQFTSASGVRWEVRGVTPSRRLIVEWQNSQFFSTAGNLPFTLLFEAVLFEGSNQIQLNYSNLTAGLATANEGKSASVGLRNANGSTRLLLANSNGPNQYVGSGKSTLITAAAPASDWYSFPVTAAGQTVSLAVNASAGVVHASLYSTNGTTLLATAVAGATNYAEGVLNFTAAAAGTYYVAVSGNGAAAAYNLTVLTGAAFDTEANNTPVTAQTLGNSRAAYGHVVSGGANDDWYSFMLPAGQSGINAETRTPSDGGGSFVNLLDPSIRVYDASGATLLASGAPLADGRNESLSITGLTAGASYLIRLAADGSTSGEYFFNLATIALPPAPKVTGVVVNAGSSQRSRVTSVAVAFDQAVTISGPAAAAFELKRQSDGLTATLAAAVDNSGSGTVVTLTFTGTTAVDFGSLADGRYTLSVFAGLITGPGGQLDGDGNGTSGDNYSLVGDTTNKLFRLFGDSNADGTVDLADFVAFRGDYGTPSVAYDFDGDGTVGLSDFVAFRGRYGAIV